MYHLNPETGNPNKCSRKSCTLEHFETKEATLKPKPTVEVKPNPKAAAKKVKAAAKVENDQAIANLENEGGIVTELIPPRDQPIELPDKIHALNHRIKHAKKLLRKVQKDLKALGEEALERRRKFVSRRDPR